MQITLIELTERRIKFENHLCNARTAIISSTEQMLRRDCLSSTSSVKTEKIRLLAHKNIGVVNIRRANTCRFVNWDLRLCQNFITKKIMIQKRLRVCEIWSGETKLYFETSSSDCNYFGTESKHANKLNVVSFPPTVLEGGVLSAAFPVS